MASAIFLISCFSSNLIRMVAEWSSRSSGGSLQRFINRDKNAGDLVSFGTKFKDAVAAFQVYTRHFHLYPIA